MSDPPPLLPGTDAPSGESGDSSIVIISMMVLVSLGVLAYFGRNLIGRVLQSCTRPKKPTEPYNRLQHYGRTPTKADRKAIGAGPGEVADHDPPLVQRYYEGDPKTGEKPGWQMTQQEREVSGRDRTRMGVQDRDDSDKQGAQMRQYSIKKKKEYGL